MADKRHGPARNHASHHPHHPKGDLKALITPGLLSVTENRSFIISPKHSTVSHIPLLSTQQEEELANDAKLHLLDAQDLKLPQWMRYYKIVSYCFFGIASVFAIFYLIYVGKYQANPWMQIQYIDIVLYLEYNSYSILSPLLCPLLMGILAYHFHRKVLLSEGDFFGVLGILLFFAIVNIHDGHAILELANREKDMKSESIDIWDPPPSDTVAKQPFHWQYAWSTKPSCARHYVRKLINQLNNDRRHVQREVFIDHNIDMGRVLTIEEIPCNKYNDKEKNAKTRQWMRDLQNQYMCCGPYGYLDWQTRFADKSKTGCNEKWSTYVNETGEIKDCYEPLMKWLRDICLNTFWIMIVQSCIYIICMILVLMHHTAMKLKEEVVAKQYSLLNLADEKVPEAPWWRERRPSDKPPIVGVYDVNKIWDDDLDDSTDHASSGDNMSRRTAKSVKKRKKHLHTLQHKHSFRFSNKRKVGGRFSTASVKAIPSITSVSALGKIKKINP